MWQVLGGASEMFRRCKQSKDKEGIQAKEANLFLKIGKLKIKLG